jgi:ribonuclease P protein component
MLGAAYRLKRAVDFSSILQEGKKVRTSNVLFFSVPNDLGHPRFGFVVSKKVSKKSVDRNYARRVLSELLQEQMKIGYAQPVDTVALVLALPIEPFKDLKKDVELWVKKSSSN